MNVTVRQPGGTLQITIENPDGVERGVAEQWVDGVAVDQGFVAFPLDGSVRKVIVRLGPAKESARPRDELVQAHDVAPV